MSVHEKKIDLADFRKSIAPPLVGELKQFSIRNEGVGILEASYYFEVVRDIVITGVYGWCSSGELSCILNEATSSGLGVPPCWDNPPGFVGYNPPVTQYVPFDMRLYFSRSLSFNPLFLRVRGGTTVYVTAGSVAPAATEIIQVTIQYRETEIL